MIRIAIDPDIKQSGVAVHDSAKPGIIQTMSLELPKLVETVTEMKNQDADTKVVIEGGWLNRSFFHMNPYDSKPIIAHKGYNVGENHRTGKLIVEFLDFNNVDVETVKPLLKCWSGRDKKITHDELTIQLKRRKLSLEKKRTNQDERDAVLLLIHHFSIKTL